LRIVLLSHGLDYEEALLRELCDCSVFGTRSELAVEAVRKLGFRRTTKQNLTWSELAGEAGRNSLPITFVSMLPLDGIKGEHAVIVLRVSESEVDIYDPLRGERTLPVNSFEAAWAAMRNLTILVEA